MPFITTQPGIMECTMGLAPCPLALLPNGISAVTPAFTIATIINNTPFLNIKPFGLCKSPANPAVAAIIASTLGSVTQGPCLPMTEAPWMPMAPTILVKEMPITLSTSKLICMYGGMISFSMPGQINVSAE